MDTGASEIEVVAFPEPFRECEPLVASVPAGQTILQILGRPDIPAVVQCDGDYIDAEHWHEVIPTGRLIIHRVPQGNIGRILGTIAIIVAAAYFAPILAGAAGFTAGTAAFSGAVAGFAAGISIVGNLALNALIPPPTPSLGGGGGIEQSPTITSQSNQVRPFAPIPRAYGDLTWYPPIPMTALPYTELQGQDQHLRMMVCLGYGPLEIGGVQVGGPSDDMIVKRAPATADFSGFDFNNNGWTAVDVSTEGGEETTLTGNPIKIGGTSIDQFEDVEFEIGRPDQVTLYSQSVVEAAVNVSMPLSTENPTEGRDVTINDNQAVVRTTEADTKEVSLDLFFPALFTLDSRGRSKWARVKFTIEYSVSGADSWTQAGPDWILSGRERRPVRQGRRVVLPSSGTWDIRLTRVSTFLQRSGGDNTWVADGTWTVLRSINRDVRPFDVDGTVIMALKIRASEQLSGRVDRLSVETTSVLPTWNGSAWVDAATRNPAWAYADILSGSATRTPLPKSQVDGATLKAWADWCTTENLYFDGVIESDGTVFDRARDAASAGFGSWSIEDDGKVSIVRDVTATPKMLVSPRNAADFRSEHAYPDLPHALRVQFIDADTLERVERIVYDDGYAKTAGGSDAAATKFEQLETIGVRDPDQAWKVGRYHLAQLRLRNETYHWRHDIQSLVYKRGDTVEIAYDVILVGLKWGRIKTLTTNVDGDATSATVDELLLMETGTDYALKIQRQNGTIVTEGIATVTPGTKDVTFAAPVSGLTVGDHFIHGVLGSESLLARISKIQPQGDLQAAITAVPAAEDIFDAWTGTIPTFDPVITQPIDPLLLPPPVPDIVGVTSGRDAAFQMVGGAEALRLAIAFSMPPGLSGVSVEARIRQHETIDDGETADDWKHLTPVPYDAGKVIYGEAVEEGQVFDVQLRSLNAARASSWSTLAQKTIGGALVFDRVGGQNLLGSDAATEESTSTQFLKVVTLMLEDIGAGVGDLLSFSADVKHSAGDTVQAIVQFRDASSAVGPNTLSAAIDSASYVRVQAESAEVPAGADRVRVFAKNEDITATAFARRYMLNLGPTALPFEEPPTRVNRGEVELGAEVNAAGSLSLEINIELDGTANSGEAILVGVTSGEPDRGKDGFIFWDGQKITLERDQTAGRFTLMTNASRALGHICFDTAKTDPFTMSWSGGPTDVDVAFVRRDSSVTSGWVYDNDGSWVEFEPTDAMVSLGPMDAGGDAIYGASLWGSPIKLIDSPQARAGLWSELLDDDDNKPEDGADVTSDHAGDISFVQGTAPSSPKVGWQWADTSTDPATVKRWSGSVWVAIGTLNLDADDLPESASKKWAAESGADVTLPRVSGSSTLVNAGFETGTTEGWTEGASADGEASTATAYRGTHSLRIADGGSHYSDPQPIDAGERVVLYSHARGASSPAPDDTGRVSIRWYDAAGTTISTTFGDAIAISTSWEPQRLVGVAPAGAASFQIRCDHNGTTGLWFFDQFGYAIWPKDTDIDSLETTNGPAEGSATKGVIDAVGQVTTTEQTDGTTDWVTAEEDTITVAAGEEVLVTTALLYRGSGATPGSGNIRILRGATVVVGPIGVTLNPTLYAAWVMPVFETPGAGSHTYKLQYQGGFGSIDMNVKQATVVIQTVR